MPNEETVEQIKAELQANPLAYKFAGAWLPVPEIAQRLCRPRVIDNPEPQPTIPRVPKESDLTTAIGIISDASMTKIVATPIFEGFIAAVKGGDRDSTLRLIVAGKKSGTITQAEHDALLALFAVDEPDPAWQATITLPPAVVRVNTKDIDAAIKEIAANVG